MNSQLFFIYALECTPACKKENGKMLDFLLEPVSRIPRYKVVGHTANP